MTCLGSAVYIFALVPTFATATNGPPTSMNLSYTLDSQPLGTFVHSGSKTPSSNSTLYLSSVPILVKTGMPDGPHTITMNIGPDSVLLLDYIVYSKEDQADLSTSPNVGGGASSLSVQVPAKTASTPSTLPSAAFSQCVKFPLILRDLLLYH